jgi:enediyne biosynthesis protein E4
VPAIGTTKLLRFVTPFIIGCAFSCAENSNPKLFNSIPASHSNIDFANLINEDTTFNIIEYLYFYNGGGVAIGDINNDGLSDIYFSGNQVSNKLYLNKGKLEFEDITEKANANGIGNWRTGVTMADVNADGFLDIFVCGVGGYKNFNSSNQLLINNRDLTFTDRTEEYGLNFTGFSTQMSFFDYDLDGDLDGYLLNHSVHSAASYVDISQRFKSDSLSGDQLFRNEMIHNGVSSGAVKFSRVTEDAGILTSRLGYGLGIAISDLNWDGYPDIYISNDFQENDYLYLNNRNGTFKQTVEKSMAHTSRFSMGNDIADINNDGLADILSTDMLPSDESVIKTSAGEDTYEIFKYKLSFGYHPQYSRNCLQLNQLVTDSSVLFSDIGMMAGVGATDWSWSPLLADFDNDGHKDLFVANGILRRPNDLDYINFISDQEVQASLQQLQASDMKILDMMPSGKVSNYFFRNTGELLFEDVTGSWGIDAPSLSNGAAYGDLDNDGDLDLVVNNLNEVAQIYRNNSTGDLKTRTIKVNLKGKSSNPFGIGAKVIAYSGNRKIYQEAYFTRGFSSSSEPKINLGIGNMEIDSMIVIWPDGKCESVIKPEMGSAMAFDHSNAKRIFSYSKSQVKPLFQNIPKKSLPNFVHQENDFNAFSTESLIPHALTHDGPPMAVGDVNGDGLDDVYFGGGKEQSSKIFIQTKSGDWIDSKVPVFANYKSEITDAVFVDADNDGDLDLVTVSGGQEEINPDVLSPRLYLNNGKGSFKISLNSFGKLILNASCVEATDYDKDGDTDLFIGASVMPQLYGMAPMSFLLVNDGKGFFTPNMGGLGSSQFDNPTRVRPGMITDAVWTNVNKDDLIDLVVVGEWMPITILIQQQDHTFLNKTSEYNLQNTHGWWKTITVSDFDADGDDDWMVGNFGVNSRLKTSMEKPVKMYLGDFDSNGGSDHILVYFNGSKSYPFVSRDQLVKQIPSLKKKFLYYKDYHDVKLEDIVTPVQQGNSAVMQLDMLESVYLENEGNQIKLNKLPVEAQTSSVHSILSDDLNEDGMIDVIIGGNISATQPDLGPYDASYGLVLLGDGKNGWKAMTMMESGLIIHGEVRSIKKVNGSGGRNYFVTRNNNSVIGFNFSNK